MSSILSLICRPSTIADAFADPPDTPDLDGLQPVAIERPAAASLMPPVALDIPAGLPPAAACQTCGCCDHWLDAYGNLRCGGCSPPPRPAFARRRITVWHAAAGSTHWQDTETGELLSTPPDAASEPDAVAAAIMAKMGPSHLWEPQRGPWGSRYVLRTEVTRDIRQGPPANMSFDEWWESRTAHERRWSGADWQHVGGAAQKKQKTVMIDGEEKDIFSAEIESAALRGVATGEVD